MKFKTTIALIAILIFNSCKEEKNKAKTPILENEFSNSIDEYTIIGKKNYLTGYAPIDSLGNVNVVIEIPTGTTAKWEVEKPSGNLKWEFVDGAPREIKYLGYPGNYGMIPRTLLPKELGGDGDPLDVLVLGSAVERGSVLKTKIIGMLKLLDRGEQDDKLIAVVEGSPFFNINSLEELDSNFDGSTIIIQTFFSNYKGPGKMKPLGWENEIESKKILDFSIEEFKKKK
ncbi:inorganic diphosphatase [Vicingaceae bacterium]|nr:inorganic diphosphatase [Vicingaceae bacterium]